MNSKPVWKSKTFWIGVIPTAIAPFIPGVSDWIAANPIPFSEILGVVFLALRFATKGAVTIS